MSDRFVSLKELSVPTPGGTPTKAGYTTNPSKLYGGVFGENLSFPAELGSTIANHYIVFFVNELMGGKYKEQAQKRLSSDSPVFYQANSTSNAAQVQKIAPVVAKVGGVAAGGVVGGAAGLVTINEGIESAVKTAKDTYKNVSTSVENGLNSLAPEYKRTSVCIALPIPDVLNTAIDAQWGVVDAELMNIAAFGNDMAGIASKEGVWGAIKHATTTGAVRGASKFMTNLIGNTGNQVTKSVNNTRRELMFDSLMPRRFSFQWTFYPKSQEESKAIWDIIQMFKYHMTPEYDEATSGLFINFPNTFDIEIHSNGKRNNWLPKTSTCALTRLDLNYTPGGTYSFFEEVASGKKNIPDGAAPVGISISAEFAEIEILYRNRLDPDGDFTFGNSATKKQRPDGGTF